MIYYKFFCLFSILSLSLVQSDFVENSDDDAKWALVPTMMNIKTDSDKSLKYYKDSDKRNHLYSVSDVNEVEKEKSNNEFNKKIKIHRIKYDKTLNTKNKDDQFLQRNQSDIDIALDGRTYSGYNEDDYDDYDESMKEKKSKKLKKHKHKHYKKFMLPLLLAYKLKFFTLVPLLLGGLVLLAGSTGLAGFFFALFAAVMGLKMGSDHSS